MHEFARLDHPVTRRAMTARTAWPAGQLRRNRPVIRTRAAHGAFQRRGQLDLGDAGLERFAGSLEADIGEARSLLDIHHLARRLDMADVTQKLGRIDDLGRRQRLAQRIAERERQGKGLGLDGDLAALQTFLARQRGNALGRVFGMQPVGADVLDPGGFRGQKFVHVAHDQAGLAPLGHEDHGLRAIGGNPGIVTAEIIKMLRPNGDAGVDARLLQCGPRACHALAVVGLGKRGEFRPHGLPFRACGGWQVDDKTGGWVNQPPARRFSRSRSDRSETSTGSRRHSL